jgi:hypothetical protein
MVYGEQDIISELCTLYDEPYIVTGQNRKMGWLEHLFRIIVMSWVWAHFRKPVGYVLSYISPSAGVKVLQTENVLILMHLFSWVKCLLSWQSMLYQVRYNTFKMRVCFGVLPVFWVKDLIENCSFIILIPLLIFQFIHIYC